MAGLNEKGFTTKRLEEILEDHRGVARTAFADLVPAGDTVDTGSNTAIGRMIGVVSPSEADLWEAMQQVYDAFNPNTATGIALDNLVLYGNLTRFTESKSTLQVISDLVFGTVIPAGSQVGAVNSTNAFENVVDIQGNNEFLSGVGIATLVATASTNYTITFTSTLGAVKTLTYTTPASPAPTAASVLAGIKDVADGGSFSSFLKTYYLDGFLFLALEDPFDYQSIVVSSNLQITRVLKPATFQATNFGPIEQQAGTITEILTPLVGWQSVTNPTAAQMGRNRETDEELRSRFIQQKGVRGSASSAAISSELLQVNGVTNVRVYENEDDTTNALGVQANSIMCVVRGGSPLEIAESIYNNKPVGIRTQGNTTINVTDSIGEVHPVRFETPTFQNVYIKLDIFLQDEFPADGVALIKQALKDYFATQFDVGEDVIYSRLYSPINSIGGFYVQSLFIGTSPSPTGVANIDIPFNKIAYTDENFIEIIT